MKMIVCKIFSCFSCLCKQLNLQKTVICRLEFIFLENVVKQTSNSFNTKFWPQWKQLASKANLEVFCNLNALILSWNCVTGVRINKIVERIKFEGV